MLSLINKIKGMLGSRAPRAGAGAGLALAAGIIGGTLLASCSDTWDDHYESLGDSTGMHEGTLWQAIKADPELSNFASVIEGCDFARSLAGSQVFTVFAPTNDMFSQQEAQQLIADYRQQVADSVVEEDNTVLKEFIQNHVALYNHSVSSLSNDSIVLMNGKYAVLSSNSIDGVSFLTKNQLYGNGILYKIDMKFNYLPNLFEYLRKDADLDSIASFMYNSHFYYKEFQASLSVPGSIVNGKTHYLDSVFSQRNELFSYLGRLNSEDSTYIMVAPTNKVWNELVEEYEQYFNYPQGIERRDSMVYTNTRLAIVQGTTFSRTFNTDASLQDSAMSVNSTRSYLIRKLMYGMPFEYYQYINPLQQPYGALAQTDIVRCSNGQVQKATTWNIDKRMGFHQWKIIEGESSSNIKETMLVADSHGDSISALETSRRYVTSDNTKYYNRVWNNGYMYFRTTSGVRPYVTYTLNNVLSNIGYDIYLVTAPTLASDSNATEVQRLPSRLRCYLKQPGKPEQNMLGANGSRDFYTTPDAVDYFLLAEDFKFDYCTYGVEDDNLQVTLRIENNATLTDENRMRYQRGMNIDCILLVPHGTLKLVDELPDDQAISVPARGLPGVLLYPHGQYDDRPYHWWYMQR